MAKVSVFFTFSFLFLLATCIHSYEAKGVSSLSREDFLFSRLRYTNVVDNIDKTQLVSSSNIPVYIGPQDGLKESDMIETLPGQSNGVDFAQYAGHVTVDPITGKALFYYFTESPQNPSSKPLVLWLNGGPGCSSLGGGAFGELGPFRPAKDGKSLNSNPYAWNNVANIIFLESPIGVGFSYSNTSSDYDNVGDESTAQDSYTFLVNWLERFPEYKTRDFYITGESYAGHYIPQLAQLILHNNQHTNQSRINLKGIAIGNAYVDYEANLQGLADYYWSHALISDELYKNILSTCNFSIPSATSDECLDLVYGQIRDESGNIYSYDIYAPLCGSDTTSYSISGYDPCTGDYTYTYLNTLQVQAALHANITATPHPWDKCNLTLHGAWKVPPTVLPVITELMGTGIRIWLYSGDTDNAVPITDTRYALYKLGVTVKTPWYPWYLPGYECRRVKGLDSSADHHHQRQLSYSPSEPAYFPVYTGRQGGLKESNRIQRLPGQPTGADFGQYAGHVTVDEAAGRALFYYFVESPQQPSSKPLVLWLNGGPAYSSVGGGAFMELGPFRPARDGITLNRNPFAWNAEANIIFLESPAGVGFSYSNTTADYDLTGDNSTALDNYAFLVNWLERFPEYKTRDFFLTGESYAGHYIPELARLILHNNQFPNLPKINLKGILVGNPYLDYETRMKGMMEYYWSHGLISDDLYNDILSTCDFSSPDSPSDKCQDLVDNQTAREMGNVYLYDIYAPLCHSDSPSFHISGFDPCTEEYIHAYLNNFQVQTALHANITATPHPWNKRNDKLNGDWKMPATVLHIVKELMQSGIRFWIYSGDTDSVMPLTDTRRSIKKLGASVKTSWYPWYLRGEVGGYAVEYENLTLVTVRGSGHFVPSYQPARALVVFTSFINGQLPPRELNAVNLLLPGQEQKKKTSE
nr:putative serine carboxypeptidase-like 23 [Ipomoea batatas]